MEEVHSRFPRTWADGGFDEMDRMELDVRLQERLLWDVSSPGLESWGEASTAEGAD